MNTVNLKDGLPPLKSMKNGIKLSDGVYITQLIDRADKSVSLSYKKKIDDAMFAEVSKIPIFTEFKQDIENLEKSNKFRAKYIKSRSQALIENEMKSVIKPNPTPSILFKIYSKLLNCQNAAKTISVIRIMLKLYFKKNGIQPPTNLKDQPNEINPISDEELALQNLVESHLSLLKTVRDKIEFLLFGTDLEPMMKRGKRNSQGYMTVRTPDSSDKMSFKDLKTRFKHAIGELNHWVQDVIEQVIIKKKACEEQMVDIQTELDKLRETHYKLYTQFEKLKIEKSNKHKELCSIKQELYAINVKLNNKFKEPPMVEKSVQTIVNCKNVPFTIVAEKILEAKIASKLKPFMSIIHKLEEDKVVDSPMPKDKVSDFMHSAYIKKAESIASQNNSMLNFEDILYSIFEQRFLFKKKIKIKCQQFLLGLREYALTDERMDEFKKFIGFDNPNKYPSEILELYIKSMKCTEESFSVILSEESEHLSLAIEKAYRNILEGVFSNASTLMKQEILISMIYESNFYCDGKVQVVNKEYQRIRKFILNKARNDDDKAEFTSNIEALLPEIIKEDLIEGTLQNYSYKDTKNFLRQTHELRIPIRKFLSIGLRTAIRFYETAKSFYSKLFKSADANGDGYIDYYEFTDLIKKIDPDKPRWKIIAIFEMTAGGSDGTNILTEDVKINFNQFLQCALSHSLMDKLMENQSMGRKRTIGNELFEEIEQTMSDKASP
ncbi:unnamed protein product [Moneuplotes crassus]|uniref:EF-hand domain-containing protein n=1 Tax=Euplotes crassus TaxID=5936 RepID=A0AAD1Y5F5_EUPCR|nr:unnamed protein product [Moneuplotes crassus]